MLERLLKRFGYLVWWWFSILWDLMFSDSWDYIKWKVFFLVIGFWVPIGYFFIPVNSFLVIVLVCVLTHLAIGSLAHLFLEKKMGTSPVFEQLLY